MGNLFSLGRATKVTFILLVVVVVFFVGFYLWDRYDEPTASALDQEAQRIEEFLKDNPANPEAWLTLASISLQQQKHDKAISEYEEVLDLVENLPAALMGLGLSYMGKGNTDSAADYLNQVVAISEGADYAPAGVSLATVYYYLGRIYLEDGKPDLAVQELNKSLYIDRINADAIFFLGQAYEAQGNATAAEAYYLRALSLVPNFTEVYIQLSDFYHRQGDEVRASYNEAMANLFSGFAAEAVEQLLNITASMPENADVFWGLGWAYEKLNEREDAIAAYRVAVSIDSTHRLAQGALSRLGADMPQE